jgi:hypothetical protein
VVVSADAAVTRFQLGLHAQALNYFALKQAGRGTLNGSNDDGVNSPPSDTAPLVGGASWGDIEGAAGGSSGFGSSSGQSSTPNRLLPDRMGHTAPQVVGGVLSGALFFLLLLACGVFGKVGAAGVAAVGHGSGMNLAVPV